ncbi:hypothetical protein [Geodermatophilus sp. URMC 63]
MQRPVDESQWGPARLLAVAVLSALAALAVLAGAVLAVVAALTDDEDAGAERSASPAPPSIERSQQDVVAAAPMPTASPEQALPGPLSTRGPEVIELPRPTGTGPAGVPTGFPRTPEGALAQLAAIDVTAMGTASLDGVRQVITDWAAPGGPTPQTWTGVHAMADLLSAAGVSGVGSAQLSVVVRPVMGLIKGTDGPDFAVVCVDLEFTVTVARTTRAAVADCQRMTWLGDRWLIGAGPEPAPAPSVWPGTEAALTAGYRELRYA